MVLPKLAGTNTLIDQTSCALVYSNKAQDADAAILDVFDLTRAEIEQARELEDLFQFVMRGAIRRPDFGGEYNVYLYDRTQALALEQYLRKHRITDDVTLVGIHEAGILDEADLSLRKGRGVKLILCLRPNEPMRRKPKPRNGKGVIAKGRNRQNLWLAFLSDVQGDR
jgi:hypothetical protein